MNSEHPTVLAMIRNRLERQTASLQGRDKYENAEIWREQISSALMILVFTLELAAEKKGSENNNSEISPTKKVDDYMGTLTDWLYVRSLIKIRAKSHKIHDTAGWSTFFNILNEYYISKEIT
jgi:hypothetical protein